MHLVEGNILNHSVIQLGICNEIAKRWDIITKQRKLFLWGWNISFQKKSLTCSWFMEDYVIEQQSEK